VTDLIGWQSFLRRSLKRASNDLVQIALKWPFSDGTYAVQLDPLSLLCRLVATVPPPRFHTVRYAGVLAPASRLRSRIAPPRATENTDADPEDAPPERGGSRCGWRPWAELRKRVFQVDLEKCLRCGSPMKSRAVITEHMAIPS
jgi:hypothetical protein